MERNALSSWTCQVISWTHPSRGLVLWATVAQLSCKKGGIVHVRRGGFHTQSSELKRFCRACLWIGWQPFTAEIYLHAAAMAAAGPVEICCWLCELGSDESCPSCERAIKYVSRVMVLPPDRTSSSSILAYSSCNVCSSLSKERNKDEVREKLSTQEGKFCISIIEDFAFIAVSTQSSQEDSQHTMVVFRESVEA